MTNICENVNKKLKTAQDTYPISKIMYSSIHHRTDLDDCITINKKIDAVNNNVKHLCSLRGYMFMGNNNSSSAFSPDSARLKDGLHLTTTGIQQLSQRINNTVNSKRDKATKLTSSHIQQPNDHNKKRLMNSKPQIRNSDIRYKPTHPRQQSVPLCISAPPHQTKIMMRDKYTPVPQHFTKRGNMPQRKVPALMDLQLNQPHSFAPWTQTPYM